MPGRPAVTSDVVQYLEKRYRPLLDLLRRRERVSFARVSPTCYVLWMPGRKATLSWRGGPLPDALEDVDVWHVDCPHGRRVVMTGHPVMMLAADLMKASRPAQ